MTTTQNNGLFFWRDHRSADPGKAKAFYTELLGWQIRSAGMDGYDYDIFSAGGEEFGGFSKLQPGEENHPAHWATYLGTPDVDATMGDVTANGGTVAVPPMDIPGIGRFAVIQDPTGAFIMPMTLATTTEVNPGAPVAVGGVTWNELLTSDVEAAVAFYGKVFGHGAQRADMGEMGEYVMLTADDTPIAGVFQRPAEMPVSAWGVYYRVGDIEAAQAKITELGGQILMPAMEVPGTGKVAAAMDSVGAHFNIHEPIS